MTGPLSLPGLGPVKPHVRQAAEEIAQQFGVRNIGGYATSGHIPGSDHYTGLALDVMTGSNVALGNRVNQWALTQGVRRFGVKYTIWQRKYNEVRGNGQVNTEPYTGSNPHTGHVHISFNAGVTVFPSDGTTTTQVSVTSMVDKVTGWVSDHMLRVVMFLAGGVLLIVGVVMFAKRGL